MHSCTMQCTPGHVVGQRSFKNMPVVGKYYSETDTFFEELMLSVVRGTWRTGQTVVSRPVRTGRTTTRRRVFGITTVS